MTYWLLLHWKNGISALWSCSGRPGASLLRQDVVASLLSLWMAKWLRNGERLTLRSFKHKTRKVFNNNCAPSFFQGHCVDSEVIVLDHCIFLRERSSWRKILEYPTHPTVLGLGLGLWLGLWSGLGLRLGLGIRVRVRARVRYVCTSLLLPHIWFNAFGFESITSCFSQIILKLFFRIPSVTIVASIMPITWRIYPRWIIYVLYLVTNPSCFKLTLTIHHRDMYGLCSKGRTIRYPEGVRNFYEKKITPEHGKKKKIHPSTWKEKKIPLRSWKTIFFLKTRKKNHPRRWKGKKNSPTNVSRKKICPRTELANPPGNLMVCP